jgi:hypothetical protein
MSRKAIPTDAQARRLAALFAEVHTMTVGEYSTTTDAAILKRAWVSNSGETRRTASGDELPVYRLNEDGVEALERYFWDKRLNRMTGGKPIF